MPEKAPTAAQLRKLDREILALLNERAAAALARGDAKDEAAEGVADPAVLQYAVDNNDGPLSAAAVQHVFRELLSGIRAAGRSLRVAYLGPEYTYSHLAAIARFGQSAELLPVASIAAVFEEVERGDAEFGVVPIENSTDGRVADSLECLAKVRADASGAGVGDDPARLKPQASSLKPQAFLQICGEVPLRIHHCLLGRGTRSEIRRVCSKPQALSQCRNWLSAHLPNVKLEPTSSTAEAASLAAAEPDTAAIAAEQAAVNHGLGVLARNIEDNPENVTRFAVIGTAAGERTGRDKTALVFEAPHKPGALADAMAIFKRQKLNLTWIESFPIPQARGRYLFFLEFQGHPADLRVKRAIASLEKKSLRLVVLGSYAEAAVVG
ncbi:MAG: chorismate mutase [Pirellulales bacterium]|nr:chorismate mutase [Pirellulales bacterium]